MIHRIMLRCCVFFVLAYYISQGHALNCYTCSSTENDYVDACVSSPTEDFVRSCDKKYCNIIRLEYKDPKDKIASMSRGCSDSYMQGVVEDSTFRTYEMSCKQDYCNTGSGKTSSDGSHNYLGDKTTIYCPGSIESSAYALFPLIPLFLVMIMNILL